MIDRSDLLKALYAQRPGKATVWEVPALEEPFCSWVLPFATVHSDRLFLIGSSFGVAPGGVVVSALHNLYHALSKDPLESRIRDRAVGGHVILRSTRLALILAKRGNEGIIDLWYAPVRRVSAAQPSDVIVTVAKQGNPLVSAAAVSLPIPRVGTKVVCLGYKDFHPHDEPISISSLVQGRLVWGQSMSYRLVAVEATVTQVFVQRFAFGYAAGPCFAVDAEVFPGQSGGPVLNSDGFVCGTVWAGATNFFGQPASLCALLYPIFLTPVTFDVDFDHGSISFHHRLIDLIDSGAIQSDGQEHLVAFSHDDEGTMINPAVHSDDLEFTFDDFDGYQVRRRPTPAAGPLSRFRRTAMDEE